VLVLLAGGVLTLVLVAWGTVQVVASMAMAESTESLSYAGVTALDIELPSGVTRIQADDGDVVRGSRHLEWGLKRPEVVETVRDGTLTIAPRCYAFGASRCEVSYDLTVPRGIRVNAFNGAGSVVIDGVEGEVVASTLAGELDITDVSGSVRLEAHAGEVRGERLRSGRVIASSHAGSIRLGFATPPESVSTRTAAGEIDIQVPQDDTVYRVDVASSMGEPAVDVNSDPLSDRSIVASTAAGSVTVHYPDR
jgi:hypothetical protein